METPYTQPQYNLSSFNCPHCKAFSSMDWSTLWTQDSSNVSNVHVCHCNHCSKYSLWVNYKMIYPNQTLVDFPNADLPDDIKVDYLEAASILIQSPRGASAILRLSIEKLVNYLNAEGKDLNAKIGFLVSNKNLNPKIQKSLDLVRVIGNNAVHPGQIDLIDDQSTAEKLFRLVNIIAKEMITEPQEVDALFDELIPEDNKIQIEKRDAK